MHFYQAIFELHPYKTNIVECVPIETNVFAVHKEKALVFSLLVSTQRRLQSDLMVWFGLVIVLRPGKQFFSHVGTEPLLPGNIPVLWRA